MLATASRLCWLYPPTFVLFLSPEDGHPSRNGHRCYKEKEKLTSKLYALFHLFQQMLFTVI